MAFAAVGALSSLALSTLPVVASDFEIPFPFATVQDHGRGGIDLALLPDALEVLADRQDAVLTGVELPAGAMVDIAVRDIVGATGGFDIRADAVTQQPPALDGTEAWVSVGDGGGLRASQAPR